MTTPRNCQTPSAYFPKPRKLAVRFIRDNRELAVLVATFVLALVLGYATRGLAWVG